MVLQNQGMFEPKLKSFYIRSTNVTQIKTLKPEELAKLAREPMSPVGTPDLHWQRGQGLWGRQSPGHWMLCY
ncbi:AP-3 complex subunit beta-1 [Myotis brandtii]|uniref:AP-3 complex subunit beta-1 n=1 Tax=Myotis brandtii TaxID=109478 RepID=S7Q9G3_MYOBR|nr:AP-3 complex subunit beta-1 [Myotis brandtii]